MQVRDFRIALFAGVVGALGVLLSFWLFYSLSDKPLGLRIGLSLIVFLILLVILEVFASHFSSNVSEGEKDKEIERFVSVNQKFFEERERKLKAEWDAKEKTDKVSNLTSN